jgi:metal-responsive CopG/Arc/MetJ family transcriptional regulator
MKVGISIPDDLFGEAERLAERQRTSRSRLYSEALREYLARHAPDQVGEALDRAIEAVGEEIDPFVVAAARARLRAVEW